MIKVAIFDDVVAARGETFNIPGLEVEVFAHADDVAALCVDEAFDVVFMDFSMGSDRDRGDDAIRALRASGFTGRVVAISSDPAANEAMRRAGADDALTRKTLLRSYLVHLGAGRAGTASGTTALPDSAADHVGGAAPGDDATD